MRPEGRVIVLPRQGVFTSVPALIGAIDDYLAHHNTQSKPSIWIMSARDIL